MHPKIILGGFVALSMLSLSVSGSAVLAPMEDILVESTYDANGELLYATYIVAADPALAKTEHYYRLAAAQQGSGAGKPGSGGPDPGTDCESDAYKTAGWHWTEQYSAQSDSYASIVSGTLNDWDSNTGAAIAGGVSSGDNGNAGTYDGVNQFEWEFIGSSSTVAVTTTWYYRGSGQAVESDAQYNTYYKWSTSGASDAMDVESVAQHETGHTFGLNHPTSTNSNSCLTMYAYVSNGATHGRTLGDGDILGIKAIYGN